MRDDDLGKLAGAAYVFARSGTTWTEQAKLLPSDGGLADRFGLEVALSGDRIVVSARGDDGLARNSGAAYVFSRSGTTWSQQAKLTPSDGGLYDHFAWSVAVSGDTVVVGSMGDDDKGADAGSIYVYRVP